MIETLQVSTPLSDYLTPDQIVLVDDLGLDAGWKRGRAGSWVHMAPGRTTVALETIQFGPNKGRTVLKAKGNLPRLVHGDGAESFTLHPDDVWRGCQALVKAATTFVPTASQNLGKWKVHRVDSNVTCELQDVDALTWLQGVRSDLAGLDDSVCSYGSTSHRAQVGKQEQLAVYSKTLDSGIRGPRDGHLVRIEDRLFGRKAREVYGDSLATVAQEGAVMARNRLENWLSRFSLQVIAQGNENVAALLIRQGMEPSQAVKMSGVALVLAAKGVVGLTDMGVPAPTAYRWKAQLEAVLVGDGASVMSWDDVVYAAGDAVSDG